MESRGYRVAVVGALGLVGGEMIRTLERRDFPVEELLPLDTASNRGKTLNFHGVPVLVGEANTEAFRDVDIALFSAGATASDHLAPQAVKMGSVVVDNSSRWRMESECPLVVPEVNSDSLRDHRGIIANPNCSTIQLVVALNPIHQCSRITRIIVSTYQAASGGGFVGYQGLKDESLALLNSGTCDPKIHSVRLAFNVVPQIDVFQEEGYTKEEYKIMQETTKIMGDDRIAVTATCARVPVFTGHSESVYIETEGYVGREKARKLLSGSAGVTVRDSPEELEFPTPAECEGVDGVVVGRIREDLHEHNGLTMWVVADNLRKGAALNAVQIAETLIAMNLIESK